MGSWVYIFSLFTSEALLFEAMTIFVLFGGYAAFWVLRKRRVGVMTDPDVPAGVIKSYLNELIIDAEQMRAQLFGLLRSAGLQAGGTASALSADPALIEKLRQLEGKMSEKDGAIQGLLQEKSRMEADLATAKTQSQALQGTSATDPGQVAQMVTLKDKIDVLEGKLAEYSVIEDDLANLKKLQQENMQLKAALAAKGGAAAAPAVSKDDLEAALAPVLPSLSTSAADAMASVTDDILGESAEVQPDAAFEGLVDSVEESLQPPNEAPLAEMSADIMGDLDSDSSPSKEKSDADLVAEFEKMLNG